MKLGLTASTRRLGPHDEEKPPQSAVRAKQGGLPSDATAMELEAPRREKKERNALETKKRILAAAEREFAAKGYDGARLGSIARTAGVQQALIHHYFGDKEGLHEAVVRQGLAAMTEGVWELLSRMDAPPPKKVTKKGAKPAKPPPSAFGSKAALRSLAEGFVDLLLRFFAENGSFLAILQHEARRDPASAGKIVGDNVGPIFEGIVARLDAMRARGDVKKDVDARHLVLSCVAMVAFPFQQEPFVTAIWPADWHARDFLEERKRHVVEMILARVAP